MIGLAGMRTIEHEHGGSAKHGAGHTHRPSDDADRRRLMIALGLILAFMAVEVAAGIVGHSLALLSDAAHMLTDAGAIVLSLVALRLAARPARGEMTFGLKRAEILSAQLNGATLGVLGVWIIYEGITRLVSPPAVKGGLMLTVALVGIVVNVTASWTLARANRENLSIEGSFRHILTDLYAFIATAIAAVLIITTGFERADAIASLFVAASMLWAAWMLIGESGRVLLEGAPKGVSVREVGMAIASEPQVCEVHDLHVWEITSGFPSLSAHVLVPEGEDCHEARRALERMLAQRFGIEHTTLQVDHLAPERLLQIEPIDAERR
jgi:cobalt-zinc-cadmium efflux system protein